MSDYLLTAALLGILVFVTFKALLEAKQEREKFEQLTETYSRDMNNLYRISQKNLSEKDTIIEWQRKHIIALSIVKGEEVVEYDEDPRD